MSVFLHYTFNILYCILLLLNKPIKKTNIIRMCCLLFISNIFYFVLSTNNIIELN